MKDSRARWISVGLILVLLLLSGSTYGVLTGRLPFARSNSVQKESETVVETAKSKVSIGENRDKALFSLSDAWFHAECRLIDGGPIVDLLFFGSHDPDEVEVIFIKSQTNNGLYIVTSIGMIENYMLHLYDHCVPLPTSAFNNS